jgi:hypothetical protein
MPITTDYEKYINALNNQAQNCFNQLKSLILDVDPTVNIVLFSKQPYFYLSKFEQINLHRRPSIMMAFYPDHVNIFTMYNVKYKSSLSMYIFTPKDTLQIYFDQTIVDQLLKPLFRDALNEVYSLT